MCRPGSLSIFWRVWGGDGGKDIRKENLHNNYYDHRFINDR